MANKTTADITKLYVGSDTKPFNFKAIDVNEGARLLTALPPESQRRVSAIADAFAKVDMPLAEELPEELRDPSKLIAFFADATKIAKGELQGISESSKALYRRMKMGNPDMAAVGSLFEGFEVFKTIRNAGGFAADVGEEYFDMLKYAYRKPMAMLTNAKENGSELRTRPTKEQILALAAVDEAVKQRLVRTEEVEPVSPAIEPNWADQAFARVNQGWNSLSTSSFGKYIRAFGYALMDMIGGKGFDLARSLTEVEKVIAAEGPQKTYQQLLDEQLASRRDVKKEERPVVLALSDIDEVAGLKAAPLFKMIEQDTPVATRDGKVAVLKKGGTQVEDVPHNGRPLELEALQQHRENQTNGSIGGHGDGGYGAAVTTGAGVLAARTAAGAVGNIVNRRSVTPAVQAATEYRAAHEGAQAAAKRLEKAEAGKGIAGTSVGVEDPAKVRTARNEAEAKLSEARVKMEQHGVSTTAVLDAEGNVRPKAEVEKLAAEQRTTHMRSQGGLEKKGAQFVDFHQAPRKWYNPSRWAGAVGDVVGSAVNTAYNVSVAAVKTAAKPLLVGANRVVDVATDIKWSAEHYMDARKEVAAEKTAAGAAKAGEAGAAAAKVSEGAAEVASKSRRFGMVGKLVAAGAALFGVGHAAHAAGVEYDAKHASGDSKAQAMAAAGGKEGLKIVGDIVAYDDFKKGDWLRGLASIFTIGGDSAVDGSRDFHAAKKVDAAKVAELLGLVKKNASHGKTGDEQLDQVLALLEMQAKGVQKVTYAPDGATGIFTEKNLGKVRRAGEADNNPFDMNGAPEVDATVAEAIDLNLRLYIARGGSLQTAQSLVKATGTLPADPALHAVGVQAEQARVAAVAAQSADAMAKARAAANRGLAFAKVHSSETVGTVSAPGATPLVAAAAMVPAPVV